jgi:hypothetical protein
VDILAGATKYQEYLLQTDTALLMTDGDFQFVMSDWTGDGRPDLIAIKKDATGSGKMEVQVYAG